MKKRISRLLTFILAAAVILSLGAPAFAECGAEFTSVYSIGDSTTTGYGLDGYKGWKYGLNDWSLDASYLHAAEGTYTDSVADALGISDADTCSMAYPAMRNRDALLYLGGDVELDQFFHDENKSSSDYIYNAIRDSGGSGDVPGTKFVEQLTEKPGDNKLVLLYGGAADVFYCTTYHMTMDTSDIPGLLETYVERLWNNYEQFVTYYPQLIERIMELNPGCTLVMLGTFNPIKDVRISDDILLPVTDAFSVLSAAVNATVKSFAEQYGGIYVDISNVETRSLNEGYTIDRFLSNGEDVYHPSPEGYDYIARRILSALEERKVASADIVVDLGSVKSVSKVVVDGVVEKNYRFDAKSHTLTVPRLLPTAKTLLVTEKRDDGSTYLVTYQLTWHWGSGYSAYRLYATRDVAETVSSVIKLTFSVASKAVGLVKGLFK